MENLAAAIKSVDAVEALDVAPILQQLSDVEQVREAVEVLLDAYNSYSGAARELHQKQCVMRTLAEVLYHVHTRHTCTADAAAAPATGTFWRSVSGSAVGATAHHSDPAWALTADDCLLLSMFLNETATTTDATTFAYWSRATEVIFPCATAMVFPAAEGAADGDEEAETTRASLESELHSLREIVAKRFSTSVDSMRRVTSYEHARRSLQRSVWALLGSLADCQWSPSSAAERVVEELEAAVQGMLLPLNLALQEQLAGLHGRSGDAAAYGGVGGGGITGGGRGGRRASPLMLASLLHDVEDVLWAISHIAGAAAVEGGGAGAASQEKLCARLAASIVEGLLKFAQQYVTLRQQLQMESMEDEDGEAGRQRRGGARNARRDVFRVYHVQRSMQRVLSVGLQLRRSAVGGVGGASKSVEVALISEVALSGLQAAASAFGGAVAVVDPVQDALAAASEGSSTAETEVGASAAAAWADSAGDAGRLRECRHVLAPPHHLRADGDGGGGGDEAAGDFLHDEDGVLLGRREAYLKSSLGPVTASALVDMVMLTVSHMDVMSEDAIQELHRAGLEQMQLAAAYLAQREEVEKLRQMERQGVEAIAAGKLIEHVKDSAALQARGMQTLRKVSARSRLERAAFSSVLGAYENVRGEAEARVRLTQALVSRCLVQLPPSLADSAMDELLLLLRKELTRAQTQKEAAASSAATTTASTTTPPASATSPIAGVESLFLASSYYQLTLQVLFMYYATQAPMHERSATWNATLILGGGGGGGGGGVGGLATALAATGEEDGAALDDGGGELMVSKSGFSIEVDSPIAFLYDDDVHRASQDVGQKRPREEVDGAGEEDAAAGARGTAAGEHGDFSFLNDTVASPSTYSHVLCRVLELIRAARLNLILLDVLLQAPVLTRYVWHHLYKHFCLSADKASCVIGMWLLRNLAVRRPVYRTCAVNILLQLCLSTHDYARRFAIKEVDQLLSASTTQGTPVLDGAAEGHLLRYAKKQLFAIPAYQRTAPTASKVKRPHDGSDVAAGDEAAAAAAGTVGGEVDEVSAKDRLRMSAVLNRRLGLFLMLCARQPRELFPALLEVFQQCVERGNTLMMQLLPENTDVRRMTQHLLKTDASNFVAAVMPLLRKRCREARPLVQSMLWAVREQLGTMAQDLASATASGSAAGGMDAASHASASAALEALRNVSSAVLGHAKAMYELSGIPLGEAAQAVSLPDIRYLAPFLSFLPATELRQTYLATFLLFVQVQLQFQRHYQNGLQRLTAKERTYVLEATELRAFQVQVLREIFVKCPVPFQDGVARGLTRVDFFVCLHRAPQESQSKRAASMLVNPLHGGHGMDTGAVGGILDGMHDGGQAAAAAAAAEAAAAKERAAELPPISVGTTKEVVNLCFELTRSFDNTTVEKLYGPPEVQRALQQLMHPPPIPSQLMATVLQAATLFLRSRYMEFIKFVVQTILTPLERASVWDTDPQLWKGVLLFAERYYRECSTFVVNLPDQVLTQALREHPQLCESFKEDHGNNASFMHILGNL
ncbi:Symplekin tight junction protein C terminal [Novymonas esmeraldas]|uniref:Symplekin tight junction protein C terminal n=1 Tax=Novymonas esmeraldas TaxID=1808958 RepID=A0AAW0F8T7_9TRYP